MMKLMMITIIWFRGTGDRQKSAKFKKPEKSSFLHSCSSRLNVKIIQPLNGPLLDLVSGNE